MYKVFPTKQQVILPPTDDEVGQHSWAGVPRKVESEDVSFGIKSFPKDVDQNMRFAPATRQDPFPFDRGLDYTTFGPADQTPGFAGSSDAFGQAASVASIRRGYAAFGEQDVEVFDGTDPQFVWPGLPADDYVDEESRIAESNETVPDNY